LGQLLHFFARGHARTTLKDYTLVRRSKCWIETD
jgi:hypothetical protein